MLEAQVPAATVVVLPKAKIDDEFRKAAVPQKPWHFGKAIDRFYDHIEGVGKRLSDFDWSGDYVIETFNYLQKTVEIDFIKSDYDELAVYLDKVRGGRHFVLTPQHQQLHLERLQTMSYVEPYLRQHYEQSRGVEDCQAGRVMKDALQFICIILEDLPEDSVAILAVE